MTEAECNTIEQANRQAWIERQEQRWEMPLPPKPIERAHIQEADLPW